MQNTLSYYSTILYKDFLAFATDEMLKLDLNYGSLPFIIYVGKYPDCTPTALKNALAIDWGYTQRSITKLVDSGFMTKEKTPSHGRTYHLNLTEKGQQAFRLSHQVFFSWDDLKLGVLNPEEKEQLFELLKKLRPARPDK